MSDAHIAAILEQLSQEEAAIFEQEPNRTWLTQMNERLQGMSVPDGAVFLRGEIPALRGSASAPAPAPEAETLPPAPKEPPAKRSR